MLQEENRFYRNHFKCSDSFSSSFPPVRIHQRTGIDKRLWWSDRNTSSGGVGLILGSPCSRFCSWSSWIRGKIWLNVMLTWEAGWRWGWPSHGRASRTWRSPERRAAGSAGNHEHREDAARWTPPPAAETRGDRKLELTSDSKLTPLIKNTWNDSCGWLPANKQKLWTLLRFFTVL